MGGGGVGGLLRQAVNVSTLGLLNLGSESESRAPIVIHQPGPAQGGARETPAVTQAERAPRPSDTAVKAAKKKQSRIAAAAGGRARNILTSGQGLTTPARTTKKTLLGQ